MFHFTIYKKILRLQNLLAYNFKNLIKLYITITKITITLKNSLCQRFPEDNEIQPANDRET